MFSDDIIVSVKNVAKCYHIYAKPHQRLLQMLWKGRRDYFREFWAVRDVSFQLRRGQTLGVIGRNGSGKSTLLQMLCGTLTPTSGEIQVQGRVAALLELGSGFNPEFTGRENVYLNASILGLSREAVDQRLDAILAFAEIGEFIDQPVKTYSSGMFVRLAFAVVAHVDADVLVIDEALAVGDAFFTQKCMRFLREFRKTGTLIFVSHDAGAVIGLCDSVLWLDKGEQKAFGKAKTLSEAYLAAFYATEHGTEAPAPVAARSEPTYPQSPAVQQRTDLVNRSTLRNDLQVFQFSPGQSADFGARGAEIIHVGFYLDGGAPVATIVGGERVELRVQAVVRKLVDNPIVGFSLKDRLGQVLFGDNTFLSRMGQTALVQAGSTIEAVFAFQMPILPKGEYSVAVAIASGTQDSHVQHHWIHDALVLNSLSSSVSTGLVGIPMDRVGLAWTPADPL